MRNWNWKGICKSIAGAVLLLTLIDISEKLGRITREWRYIESNTAATFTIPGRERIKTAVQSLTEVRVVR